MENQYERIVHEDKFRFNIWGSKEYKYFLKSYIKTIIAFILFGYISLKRNKF